MTLNEAIRELEAIKASMVESFVNNGLSEEKALNVAGNASLVTRYPGGNGRQLTSAHITAKYVECYSYGWKEHCVQVGVYSGDYEED